MTDFSATLRLIFNVFMKYRLLLLEVLLHYTRHSWLDLTHIKHQHLLNVHKCGMSGQKV